jgi:hypothetical protein
LFVINSKLIKFAQNGLVSLSLCREARPRSSESEQCPFLLSRPRSLRKTHIFLGLPFALFRVRQCVTSLVKGHFLNQLHSTGC